MSDLSNATQPKAQKKAETGKPPAHVNDDTIDRAHFLSSAPQLCVVLYCEQQKWRHTMAAKPREFRTGRVGWRVYSRTSGDILADDQYYSMIISVNVTVIGVDSRVQHVSAAEASSEDPKEILECSQSPARGVDDARVQDDDHSDEQEECPGPSSTGSMVSTQPPDVTTEAVDQERFLAEAPRLHTVLCSTEQGWRHEVVARPRKFRTGRVGWHASSRTTRKIFSDRDLYVLVMSASITLAAANRSGTPHSQADTPQMPTAEEVKAPPKRRPAPRVTSLTADVGKAQIDGDDDDSVASSTRHARASAQTHEESSLQLANDNFQHVDELFRRTLAIGESSARCDDEIIERPYSDVLFFPDLGGHRFKRLLKYVASARRTLDVCIYTFTETRLRDVVIECHQRGVAVRVLADLSMAKERLDTLLSLQNAGVPVALAGRAAQNTLHHKFAIVDNVLLLNGSFNWTLNAACNNCENITATTSVDMVPKFVREFSRLWLLYRLNGCIEPSDVHPRSDEQADTRNSTYSASLPSETGEEQVSRNARPSRVMLLNLPADKLTSLCWFCRRPITSQTCPRLVECRRAVSQQNSARKFAATVRFRRASVC